MPRYERADARGRRSYVLLVQRGPVYFMEQGRVGVSSRAQPFLFDTEAQAEKKLAERVAALLDDGWVEVAGSDDIGKQPVKRPASVRSLADVATDLECALRDAGIDFDAPDPVVVLRVFRAWGRQRVRGEQSWLLEVTDGDISLQRDVRLPDEDLQRISCKISFARVEDDDIVDDVWDVDGGVDGFVAEVERSDEWRAALARKPIGLSVEHHGLE